MDAIAPAPTPTPDTTISATRDAANQGDFAAFDKADIAARSGKPLEPVAATEKPVDGADASGSPAERQVSRRQQDANERTRAAVERATSDLRAELDRVKAQMPAPVQANAALPPAQVEAPQPVAVPPEKFQAMEAWLKTHPEGSLEDFLDARDDWRDQRAEVVSRQRTAQQEHDTQLRTQAQSFAERLTKAKAEDPEFVTSLRPELASAKPLSGLKQGERATFANVVAEIAFHSEAPAALLKHLSLHPEDAETITTLPQHQWLTAVARLDGRLVGAPAPSESHPSPSSAARAPATAAAPSPISAAPVPSPSISRARSTSDPQASAFSRNDFAEWDRIEQQKERGKRGVA